MMYDTIGSWLGSEMIKGSGYLKTIPTLLTNTKYSQRENGTVRITGSLDNLFISVSDFGISINGSFNKYYHGNNFCKFTRQEMELCVEKLQDYLHLNLKDAKINRLDIAHNFIMEKEVETYYNFLGNCQYYSRLVQPNSIYYNSGLKTKLFYNKIKEGKFRRLEIPQIWTGKNVLRYELRYKNKIPQQFKRDRICLSDLYNESFYIDIIERWLKEYFLIKKNRILIPKIHDMTNRNAKEQLLSGLIDMFGQNEVNTLIESWKPHFTTPKEAQRFKKSLEQLKGLTEESPLMKELDEKILRVKEYYR